MIRKLILIFGIITGTINSFGQIPVIETPKAATFQNYTNFGTMQTGNQNFIPNYIQNNGLTNTQINNQAIMQEVQYYEQLRQKQNEILNDDYTTVNSGIQYNLPSFADIAETEYFRQAFNEINQMLNGTRPLDLKRAVFLTENAYISNQLDYNQFNNRIKQETQLAKLLIRQKGYKENENLSKNLALYQYMCDTSKFYDYSQEGTAIHTPYTYDFDDFFGKEDWTKIFVSKLLVSKSGQCHSLPLLYLIYAQEIGSEAYLAYSPSHSYIKFQDKYKNWYNLELTNGMLISDAAIMASGYIKTEAIQNGIYMDTISNKQAISTCLVDLAKGYYHKFGYDDFMIQCADTALKYFPKNVDALQVKADYYTLLTHHVGRQLPSAKTLEEMEKVLQNYPKAKEIREKRNELYQTIDNLGFETMPEAEYQSWLNSVRNEASKRESQCKVITIQKTIR